MNVRKLISELRKFPGDYEVGVAAHDNLDGEIAGYVSSVHEYDPDAPKEFDNAVNDGKVVILSC